MKLGGSLAGKLSFDDSSSSLSSRSAGSGVGGFEDGAERSRAAWAENSGDRNIGSGVIEEEA